MPKPIKVGVVGCGYWGPNLIRNFNSLPNCALRGMCDVNEKRLKHLCTLYSDIPAMTDYQQLLRLRGLEAVVIATPVKHHFSLAKASLLFSPPLNDAVLWNTSSPKNRKRAR